MTVNLFNAADTDFDVSLKLQVVVKHNKLTIYRCSIATWVSPNNTQIVHGLLENIYVYVSSRS